LTKLWSAVFQTSRWNSREYLLNRADSVFHNGDDGFAGLPRLVEGLLEPRLNLSLLYIREDNPAEAYHLLQKFQPIGTNNNILKATVWLTKGSSCWMCIFWRRRIASSRRSARWTSFGTQFPTRMPGDSEVHDRGCDKVLRTLQTIEPAIDKTDEFNYNTAMALALLSRWRRPGASSCL
jgi:hypothetical protein